jgi:hypothetical protein
MTKSMFSCFGCELVNSVALHIINQYINLLALSSALNIKQTKKAIRSGDPWSGDDV